MRLLRFDWLSIFEVQNATQQLLQPESYRKLFPCHFHQPKHTMFIVCVCTAIDLIITVLLTAPHSSQDRFSYCGHLALWSCCSEICCLLESARSRIVFLRNMGLATNRLQQVCQSKLLVVTKRKVCTQL